MPSRSRARPAPKSWSDVAVGDARGILLVHHGLAEHSGRYARFADEIAALGFHVYAHDHRGHGGTRASDAPPRRFASRDGAQKVLEDCRSVHLAARAEHPGLPVIVFGHSMGGLIAMNYGRAWGPELAGLCVWNANFDAGLKEWLARILLTGERALKGSDVTSEILSRATFDAWGRSIADRRTEADWLSHDDGAVDAYVADPLCGWRPTISMYEDIMTLIFDGGTRKGLADLPPALPLHCLGGGEDPATAKGIAVTQLCERARHAGSTDVTCLVVEGARHETLNEIETFRQPAMASLTAWLNRVVPSA